MSQLFASGGQSIGVKASAEYSAEYYNKYLGLVSSMIGTQEHHNMETSILRYNPTLTSIREYWKKHSFE